MDVCLFAQELSFELMYKKQPLLTKNTGLKCTNGRTISEIMFFLCSASRWCSQNRSPSRLPFSPKYNFLKLIFDYLRKERFCVMQVKASG